MYVMNLTNGKLKVEESKQLKLLIKQVKKLKKLSKKPIKLSKKLIKLTCLNSKRVKMTKHK